MNINCPICNSNNKDKITKLSNNMKIMGDSFPESTSTMVFCKDCGVVFVDTDAKQAHFSKYYNSGYSKTISYNETFGTEIANEYFNNIYKSFESHISIQSQILDMGAGRGEFSEFLIKRGYKNVLAMEPSECNCKHIQSIGIKCLQDDSFTQDNSLKGKFDLIVLSHTLEHILDFKKALVNIKSMLKKDGILYIEVPDSKRYIDVDFPPYFFFTYEHVIHMSLETFNNLAFAYSFELLQTNAYLKCNSYYVMNVLLRNNGEKKAIVFSDATKTAIENYSLYSKNKLEPVVKELENSQEPLILWGIGASTALLLNDTFENCQVVSLVDSNPSRQGIEYIIGGNIYKIKSPKEVLNETGTIVVLPIMYKKAIIEQIKKLGFKNKIKSLV